MPLHIVLRRAFQTVNILFLALAITAKIQGFEPVSTWGFITGIIGFICLLPLEHIKPAEMERIGVQRMVNIGAAFVAMTVLLFWFS